MNWVQRLRLEPHPEGGFFRRIYTDPQTVMTAHGPRPAATSIHYLLTRDSPVGYLHRNRSTILHYWQHGAAVEYWLLSDDGSLQRIVLGDTEGSQPFLAVPGGVWKASRLLPEADHALISEVVVPGFDYADHEFLTQAVLLERFAQHADTLRELVKPDALLSSEPA